VTGGPVGLLRSRTDLRVRVLHRFARMPYSEQSLYQTRMSHEARYGASLT
jgi:hypothetical protein